MFQYGKPQAGSRLERLESVAFETGAALVRDGRRASSDRATDDLKRDFMFLVVGRWLLKERNPLGNLKGNKCNNRFR